MKKLNNEKNTERITIRFLSAFIGSFNASRIWNAFTLHILLTNKADVTCPMARQKIIKAIVLKTRYLRIVPVTIGPNTFIKAQYFTVIFNPTPIAFFLQRP